MKSTTKKIPTAEKSKPQPDAARQPSTSFSRNSASRSAPSNGPSTESNQSSIAGLPLGIAPDNVILERPPGTLGSVVTYRDVVWKIAYLGPVFFQEGTLAGLIQCQRLSGAGESIGNTNGTVDGVTYFTCDENMGIFVPHQQLLDGLLPLPSPATTVDECVLSGLATPQDNSTSGSRKSNKDELSGSLVVGAQSIRRLRDEALQDNISPNNRSRTRLEQRVDACTETDAFMLSQVPHLPRPTEWLSHPGGGSTSQHVSSQSFANSVATMFGPMREAASRITNSLTPLMTEEREWLEETKKHVSALQEPLEWESLLDDELVIGALQNTIQLPCGDGDVMSCSNSGTSRDESCNIASSSRMAPFVECAYGRSAEALSNGQAAGDNLPQQFRSVVDEILASTKKRHSRHHHKALEALARYANAPPSRVLPMMFSIEPCVVPRDKVNHELLKVAKDSRHALEQYRRLAFAFDECTKEGDAAATEGNVDVVEAAGHSRVSTAQTMQRIALQLLAPLGELQQQYVEDPLKSMRSMIADVEASLCKVRELAQAESSLHQDYLSELQSRIDSQRDQFLKEAFRHSQDVVTYAQRVADLHDEEQAIATQLQQILCKWEQVRIHKINAMDVFNRSAQERARLFQVHHEEMAQLELERIVRDSARSVADRSAAFADTIRTQVLREVKEAEEATIMEIQRTIFERKSSAHELHKEAFRNVCIATEELTFRKQQAHAVICDRLDRCTAEMEIAMDSLDPRAKSAAREKRELENVAREMHGDIMAIKAITESSGVVFNDRTAKFFLECGKAFDDPRDEMKRITAQRRDKMLLITDTLKQC